VPVNTHSSKKNSILKYLGDVASVTQFIIHVGVHECIDRVQVYTDMEYLVCTVHYSWWIQNVLDTESLLQCNYHLPPVPQKLID